MTYEYLCKACGHQWEAEQPISAQPLRDCPHCGQAEAKRQISRGGGFILKGGGWYSDLYSSPSKQTSEPSTDASASPPKDAKADLSKSAEPGKAAPSKSEPNKSEHIKSEPSKAATPSPKAGAS